MGFGWVLGGFWVVFKDRMLSLKAVMQYMLLSINPTNIIVLINGLVAMCVFLRENRQSFKAVIQPN